VTTETVSHKCNCCGEVFHTEPRKDEALGTVCEPCHYRLRVSGAWLKHHGMKTFQNQIPGSPGHEGRALV
jgi:hypothetical protein